MICDDDVILLPIPVASARFCRRNTHDTTAIQADTARAVRAQRREPRALVREVPVMSCVGDDVIILLPTSGFSSDMSSRAPGILPD